MKRTVTVLLAAFLLLTALCACGGGEVYTLFAYDYDGYVIASAGMTSELALNDNGSGKMEINGESGRISWTVQDGQLTVRSGSDSLYGTLRDGIIVLDPGDGNCLYYAAEGADISSVPVMSFEDYVIRSVHEGEG